jgi:hypothetical protein
MTPRECHIGIALDILEAVERVALERASAAGVIPTPEQMRWRVEQTVTIYCAQQYRCKS